MNECSPVINVVKTGRSNKESNVFILDKHSVLVSWNDSLPAVNEVSCGRSYQWNNCQATWYTQTGCFIEWIWSSSECSEIRKIKSINH